MLYNLEKNISNFKFNDEFGFINFKNKETIILEFPTKYSKFTKYQLMKPSIRGMFYYGATNLIDGTSVSFTEEKWNDLHNQTSEYMNSHPIVNLEKRTDEIHKKIIKTFGLEEIKIRNLNNLKMIDKINSLRNPSNIMPKYNKIKPYSKDFFEILTSFLIMPYSFAKDIQEIITPKDKKYIITNLSNLKKEGNNKMAKISFDGLEFGRLPQIYFPNGISLSHNFVSDKVEFDLYKNPNYYIEIEKNLQNELFTIVDEIKLKHKKIDQFSKKIRHEKLKTLIDKLR